MVNFPVKPKRVKVLYLDNGIVQVKKVYDLGDILFWLRGPKIQAWAKGKPIISTIRGLKGPTWICSSSLAWTLDEAGFVAVLKKGKAYLLNRLLEHLVRLSKEADGAEELKAHVDQVKDLSNKVDDLRAQLAQVGESAAKESAARIAAEASLAKEVEARQRAEAAADQERQKREALVASRTAPSPPNPRARPGGQKKAVKGAQKVS